MKSSVLLTLMLAAPAMSRAAAAQVQQPSSDYCASPIRWGAMHGAIPGHLDLKRIDLSTNTMTSASLLTPTGTSGPLVVPPVVSPDDSTAAIAMSTVSGTLVCVLRRIRGPSIAQTTSYWLPPSDPASTGQKIVGAPRFLNDGELWVLESTGNESATRLARYQLGATSAVFLGAANLVDPLHPAPYVPAGDWMIHASTAVILQQNAAVNGIGLEVVFYGTGGAVVGRIPVDQQGFAVFHAAFAGLRELPGSPTWGFMQYGVAANGTSHARLLDLASGALTNALAVNPRQGRFATDRSLGLFADIQNPSTLVPVKLPPILLSGQDLVTLPSVPNFFCAGDSVAADGGYILTAPSACQGNWVHRTNVDALGQLQIVSISTSTGNLDPFVVYVGSGLPAPAFSVPGLNRVYALTGGTLQHLDVMSMTYGTQFLGAVSVRHFL